MTPRIALISLLAALSLAACNDESAEAPNEYDVGPTEEAAPAEEPVVEETEAAEPIVITVPTAEQVVEQVSETAEQVVEQASQVTEDIREAASEQLNELTDGQPAMEAAEEAVQGVATAIGDQLSALVPDQDAAEEVMAEVDWQSTYAAEVPFYNLSEQAVDAYDGPEDGAVVASVGPGEGGYIETCNATLDWCALSIGDGSTVWVEMEPFGGVAN
ncbi:MAG: hypothetical protein Rhims3KO_20670 [Hyphomicrobiales bacterium]